VPGSQLIHQSPLAFWLLRRQYNRSIQSVERNLHFSLDKESGILITKVIDTKSNDVIRQIPNEETVALARSLTEQGHEAEFKIFSSTA
jgi:uncharacterized FlaG/YvyC family protein